LPKEKKQHVAYQKAFFDTNVDMFKAPIPDDIVERSREIVKAVVNKPAARILDVGTGIGAFIKYYLECGITPENIVGCDLSSEMLAEAKRRHPNIQLWQGDAADLPDEFGNFDIVVFNACFGNIFDQLAVLRKTRSHLNAGGRIAISHPMGNDFVRRLKEGYPDLVFTLLPERGALEDWCRELDMSLSTYRDEANLYLAIFEIA
jgi:ubiquinone/menaquinone biosynthesis C-methylase UbiE